MTQRSIEETKNDIINLQDKITKSLKERIKTLEAIQDKQSENIEMQDKIIDILEKNNSLFKGQIKVLEDFINRHHDGLLENCRLE